MNQPNLDALFERLLDHFGPRGWWPAETPWEVAVGAVLTQAVAWRNVTIAIARLKARDALSWEGVLALSDEALWEALRPTRYFREKAAKLRALAQAVSVYGSLGAFLEGPLPLVRQRLLAIHGIGRETADDILLYAGDHLSFVVDTYTHRILLRMGWYFEERYRYEALRQWVMERIPADLYRYREFHALLDGLGHSICRPQPLCAACPVRPLCQHGRSTSREE